MINFSLTLIIIILTVFISFVCFGNKVLRDRLTLHPYIIKRNNEFHRFLTSGFLHADWLHLLVNMWVLWIFGELLEHTYLELFGSAGRILFIVLYLLSIIAANALSYFKHQDDPYYASLGASGAVSAVLFATILIYPTMPLMLIFLPIPIPAVILGVLYLIYSVYMSKRGGDNINHEAHFLGAVFGIVFTLILEPRLFFVFMEGIKELLGGLL